MTSNSTLTKSYLHVPRKLPFTGNTVGQQLYEAAHKYRDREMFVFYSDNERITFKQMKDKSQRFAASLISKGMKRGDRMAVWGANHSEWLVAFFACTQLGILLVQFRLEFRLETIATLIKKVQCKALLLTRSPGDLLEKASKVIQGLCEDNRNGLQRFPDLKFIIHGDQTTCQSSLNRHVYNMTNFLQLGSKLLVDDVAERCRAVDMDDPCLVYFTSGSTGLPKAATSTHHALLNNAMSMGAFRLGVNGLHENWDSVRFAVTLSFGGSASLLGVFLPLVRGCTSVVLYETFDVHKMAMAIQNERVTEGLFFIHHMDELVNLPNIDDYDFSSLRIACMGGSFIPRELLEKIRRIAEYKTAIFGMSETAGIFLGHPFDPHGNDVLYPVDGIEVKIVDNEGFIVPVNTQGEVHVRSYSLFLHYMGDEERTKDSKDCNGWFHTGDIGEMNSDGFLLIRDRKKETINKSAQKLSPTELEIELHRHSGILGALVVGVPDERTCEEVCACVRVDKVNPPTADEIREHCRGKVNPSLIPKYVLFVEDFPTTETGKFSRKKMTEKAREILDLPLPDQQDFVQAKPSFQEGRESVLLSILKSFRCCFHI